MEELISKKDLYDKIVKLELSALEQMKTLAKLENTEEYNKMNAVLMERTAFKYDVVDAPVILEIPDSGIGDLSDGYHTFNQLYYQRMMLFVALVRVYKSLSWKSRRHEDGELCFNGGWFVVGIDTPQGSYTYHYEDKYWDMFDCEELPVGKHWDGHTEEDVTRLLSLPVINEVQMEDLISRQDAIEAVQNRHMMLNKEKVLLINDLEKLPSAEPQRMKAKWIATTALQEGQITWRDYKCSNCSHHRGKPMNFCEVCGAKMEM